jgi:hypothetical protein
MPQAADLVIADGSSTPVNRTFVPVQADPSGAVWRFVQGETSASAAKIFMQLKEANKDRRTDRVTFRFEMPIEKEVDGTYVVEDVARFSGDFTIPVTLTLSQKADLLAFVKNTIATAIMESYVKDQIAVY